jgi:hypothetical protein
MPALSGELGPAASEDRDPAGDPAMRDTDATAPRLVLPSWRIAREATLDQLCTAFVDRGRAEGLAPATQRYYR